MSSQVTENNYSSQPTENLTELCHADKCIFHVVILDYDLKANIDSNNVPYGDIDRMTEF